MTKRTDNYLVTIPNDSNADEYIRTIRKALKLSRKEENIPGLGMRKVRYYLTVRPRLGKDNPNAFLYRRGGMYYRPSSLDIRREHGTRLDLYIHRQIRWH